MMRENVTKLVSYEVFSFLVGLESGSEIGRAEVDDVIFVCCMPGFVCCA